MAGFDHKTIDAKWQKFWDDNGTFLTPKDRTKPKYYVLDMFPYPSGDGLHVGHPKGYTATDVVARAKRMMGFNVLRVMGWDSFGLPAERRAERTGEHPSVITERNINTFKGQLKKLGVSYDWTRELATSDPKYYKWTQWIFEVLYERGLAYRAEVPVNFCPAPTTMICSMYGLSRILFSMGCGATYFPPDVLKISFLRSVIFRKRSSTHIPISPV